MTIAIREIELRGHTDPELVALRRDVCEQLTERHEPSPTSSIRTGLSHPTEMPFREAHRAI